MTQAFNLSQFANKVNTSGQADLTTAVTGTLPIANGGTGVTTTPANGAIPIGTGTTYSVTTLTAGTGISVTNASGSVFPSTIHLKPSSSVESAVGLIFSISTSSSSVCTTPSVVRDLKQMPATPDETK